MQIKIKIDDSDIMQGLKHLQEACVETGPLMKRFAGMMATETANAFNRQKDPVTGEEWLPLSPSYRALRIKNGQGESILNRSGSLKSSISREYGKNYALVGSNKPYAAIHHFGGMAGRGRKVSIPARPYFGVSDWQLSRMRRAIVESFSQALTK